MIIKEIESYRTAFGHPVLIDGMQLEEKQTFSLYNAGRLGGEGIAPSGKDVDEAGATGGRTRVTPTREKLAGSRT